MKIANEMYGYSKCADMGKFNHSRKGAMMDRTIMDRTTEDITTLVPPKIMEYYKNIRLDIDLLFVNKIPFLLAKSQDIRFIHCKALLSKYNKRE